MVYYLCLDKVLSNKNQSVIETVSCNSRKPATYGNFFKPLIAAGYPNCILIAYCYCGKS